MIKVHLDAMLMEGEAMTEKPVCPEKCPFCGIARMEGDYKYRPFLCGSFPHNRLLADHRMIQVEKCKDRQLSQQAAELLQLRSLIGRVVPVVKWAIEDVFGSYRRELAQALLEELLAGKEK